MRKTIVVVILAALSGCVSTEYWKHSNKGEQEFYADLSHCESISQTWETVPFQNTVLPTEDTRRFENCMRGKGWAKVNK